MFHGDTKQLHPEVESREEVEVTVTFVESPSWAWVLPASRQEELEDIMDQVSGFPAFY